MTEPRGRVDGVVSRFTELVVSNPRAVILLFLVVTTFFAAGIPAVETETELGDRYSEGLEVREVQDAVEEEFEQPFAADDRSTQLIHDGTDVLTREELVHVLRLLERVDDRQELRMESASGPPTMVARTLDPTAATPAEQRRAVERATETEVRRAVREASTTSEFSVLISDDYNHRQASASASVTVISHDAPTDIGEDEMERIITTIDSIADDEPASLRAFGSDIVESELADIIGDSFVMVMPVVGALLLGFLAVAYRDPFDLLLGLVALVMTLIWTFGFLGHAGISIGQEMLVVPVLLLAVGVDFGIHSINRYREEKVRGRESIPAMRIAITQLTVAFFIVTVTAVFGFGSNVFAELGPMRELGLAAAVGIVFTFFIFGGFLPAIKLRVDRYREQYGLPEFDSTPIASEESSLGRTLSISADLGGRAPAVLIVCLLILGIGMGAYGTGVDTTFEDEDFLPPEEEAWYVDHIPEPLAPDEYVATETLNLLEDRFAVSQDQTVTIYVEGHLEEGHALAALDAPDDDPPETLAVGPEGGTDARSIVTVIDSYAEQDPEFAALVARNDRSGDGVPDRNLGLIYDELFASPAGPQAERHLTDDRRATRIEYSIDADATLDEIAADAADHADAFRHSATATGMPILYHEITELIFESAIQGMVLALVLSTIVLVLIYGGLDGRPWLGVINVFPIALAIACLLGTMRLLDMPLNAVTALLLSFSIGIGIDYTVHFMHRFIDEYNERAEVTGALTTTLATTGGALTGSMLTTSIGTGALTLAITPVLGDFGLLIGLSVLYSFVGSIVALPPALFLWDRFIAPDPAG